MDMDVMLSLINGVNGSKHKGEYDNGVVQVRWQPLQGGVCVCVCVSVASCSHTLQLCVMFVGWGDKSSTRDST
jgi:hypothetical protein